MLLDSGHGRLRQELSVFSDGTVRVIPGTHVSDV